MQKFTEMILSAASVCQSSCTVKTGRVPKLEELLFLSKTSRTLSLATRDTKLELNIVNSRKQQFSDLSNDNLLIKCALVPIYFDFGLVLTLRILTMWTHSANASGKTLHNTKSKLNTGLQGTRTRRLQVPLLTHTSHWMFC